MTTVPMPKQGPLLPPAQRGPGGPRASDKANMVVSCRRGRLPREQEPRLEACRCVTAGAPEDSCTRTRARPGVGARKLGGAILYETNLSKAKPGALWGRNT